MDYQYDWRKIITAVAVVVVVCYVYKHYIRESFRPELQGVDFKTTYGPEVYDKPTPQPQPIMISSDLQALEPNQDKLQYAELQDSAIPTTIAPVTTPVSVSPYNVVMAAATSGADLEPARLSRESGSL